MFREGEIVVVMFDGYRIVGAIQGPELNHHGRELRGWWNVLQIAETDTMNVHKPDATCGFVFGAAEEFIARLGDPLPMAPMQRLLDNFPQYR